MNDIGILGAALYSGLFVHEVEEAIKDGELNATENPDGSVEVDFADVIDWLADRGEPWTPQNA